MLDALDIQSFMSADSGFRWKNLREFKRDDLDRLFNIRLDMNEEDRKHVVNDLYLWMEEVRRILAEESEVGDWLQAHIAFGAPRVAYQHVQITAAMLESSDDPDGNPVERSVLTTESESDYEFNWLMSRHSRIILGPGEGVVSHALILDRDDMNQMIRRYEASGGALTTIETNVARPYGMSGLKLQFGSWKVDGDELKFWPTSVAVDSFTYLEQILPMRVRP